MGIPLRAIQLFMSLNLLITDDPHTYVSYKFYFKRDNFGVKEI